MGLLCFGIYIPIEVSVNLNSVQPLVAMFTVIAVVTSCSKSIEPTVLPEPGIQDTASDASALGTLNDNLDGTSASDGAGFEITPMQKEFWSNTSVSVELFVYSKEKVKK